MKNIAVAAFIMCSIVSFAQKKSEKLRLLKNDLGKLHSAAVASVSNLYTFSTFTAPYVPITGSSLTNGEKWDDLDFAVPLGFNFPLYSKLSSTYTLYIGGQVLSPDDLNSATQISFASAMFEDLCDRAYNPATDSEGDPGGLSPITYTTTGTPGNRICKIQMSNAAFYSELDLAANDTSKVNFQIWLYEGSGDIELRYGLVDIKNQIDNLNNGTDGFICGLTDDLDISTFSANGGSNMLQGPSASPSVTPWSASFNTAVTPDVSNGRVYRFQRNNPNTGLANVADIVTSSIYPNPVATGAAVKIKGKADEVNEAEILDLTGRLISVVMPENGHISLQNVHAGVYMLRLKKGSEVKSQTKLIVAD